MVKEINIEGQMVLYLNNGTYKCQCGNIIKKKENLSSHLKTKSHWQQLEYRKLTGNNVVFTSLLVDGLKVYR